MTSIIKSVSIDEDENNFLEDFKLSPTKLLREKIWEMKGMLRHVAQKKIDSMVKVIEEQAIGIERRNVYIKKVDDVLEKAGLKVAKYGV